MLLQDVDEVVARCRKTGLTSAPTITSSDDRRYQGEVAQRGASGDAACRRRTRAAAGAGAVGASCQPWRSDSFDRRRPARGRASRRVLGDDPAVEHHQDPVAEAQVVELVGDDEHGGAAVARRVHDAPSRDSLDCTSTPAVGLISTSSRGVVGQRAGHDDLLLVAAGQVGDRRSGPAVLMSRSRDQSPGEARRRGAGATKPSRPSRSGTVMVALSRDRHAGDEALVGAGPAARSRRRPRSAAGTLAGRQPRGRRRRPCRRSASRSPTTVSASSILPLPPAPARPTISPRAHGEVDVRRTRRRRSSPSRSSSDRRAGGRRRAGRGRPGRRRLAGHRLDQVGPGSSATGAVTMSRASRSTVTVWQIS